MKRLLFLLLTFCVIGFIGCNKTENVTPPTSESESSKDSIVVPEKPSDIYYIKYVGSYAGGCDYCHLSGTGPDGWESITLTSNEGELGTGPVTSGFVAEGQMAIGNKNEFSKTTNLSIYISKDMGPYILVKTVSETEKAYNVAAKATYVIP